MLGSNGLWECPVRTCFPVMLLRAAAAAQRCSGCCCCCGGGGGGSCWRLLLPLAAISRMTVPPPHQGTIQHVRAAAREAAAGGRGRAQLNVFPATAMSKVIGNELHVLR